MDVAWLSTGSWSPASFRLRRRKQCTASDEWWNKTPRKLPTKTIAHSWAWKIFSLTTSGSGSTTISTTNAKTGDISWESPPILPGATTQKSLSQFVLFPTFPNSHAKKMKEPTSLFTTSGHFPFGCKTLLQPFRFLSGFPYSLSASLPTAAFLHGKCFPHTPEAKTHARFLSAFPKPPPSASPEAV